MATVAVRIRAGAATRADDQARPGGAAGHFPLLDAGRGLAAIAVLIHHIGNEAGIAVAKQGHLAVDYFLMLSGFVVAMAYEGRLRDDRLSFRGFVGVRARRLYPMIFLGSVLATGAYLLAPNPDVRLSWVLLQFLLVPAMASWVIFPLNGPLWSLFYESIANGLHGLTFAFWRTRTIALALAPLLAGAAAIAVVRGDYDWGFRPGEEWIALVRVLAAYLAGVLIWRLKAAGRLPRVRAPAIVPLALVLLPLLAPARVPATFVTLMGLFVCFPAAILCALEGRAPGSWAAWLGGLSYPLYAIHMPVILAGKALGLASGWGWAGLGVAAVLAASAAERWYDAPIRARLKARSGRPRVEATIP